MHIGCPECSCDNPPLNIFQSICTVAWRWIQLVVGSDSADALTFNRYWGRERAIHVIVDWVTYFNFNNFTRWQQQPFLARNLVNGNWTVRSLATLHFALSNLRNNGQQDSNISRCTIHRISNFVTSAIFAPFTYRLPCWKVTKRVTVFVVVYGTLVRMDGMEIDYLTWSPTWIFGLLRWRGIEALVLFFVCEDISKHLNTVTSTRKLEVKLVMAHFAVSWKPKANTNDQDPMLFHFSGRTSYHHSERTEIV
jgi:hypothetical protein